jgi:hypothetical protein
MTKEAEMATALRSRSGVRWGLAVVVLGMVLVAALITRARDQDSLATTPPLQLVEMHGSPIDDAYGVQLRAFHDALARADLEILDLSFAPTAIQDDLERSTFWHDASHRQAALLALSTHPAITDGLTYPGFMLGGFTTPLAIEDAERLGLAGSMEPPANGAGFSEMQADYTGWVIVLEDEPATSDALLVVVTAGPWNT